MSKRAIKRYTIITYSGVSFATLKMQRIKWACGCRKHN